MELEKLVQLNSLKEKGIITEDEFNEQKTKLLSTNVKEQKKQRNHTKLIVILIGIILFIALSIPVFKGIYNGISDYVNYDPNIREKFKEDYATNCYNRYNRAIDVNDDISKLCDKAAKLISERLEEGVINSFLTSTATHQDIEILKNLEKNILREIRNEY